MKGRLEIQMASCRSKPAITRESGASRGQGMDRCYFSWRSRHFFTKKLGEKKFSVNSTNSAHCLLVNIMTKKKHRYASGAKTI